MQERTGHTWVLVQPQAEVWLDSSPPWLRRLFNGIHKETSLQEPKKNSDDQEPRNLPPVKPFLELELFFPHHTAYSDIWNISTSLRRKVSPPEDITDYVVTQNPPPAASSYSLFTYELSCVCIVDNGSIRNGSSMNGLCR
jgi:hypothetical protein